MINKFKDRVGKRNVKRSKDFIKYTFVGIIWITLTALLMWFFIDYLKFSTIIGSSIATLILFISKYYAYILVKLINRGLLKYTLTSIAFTIAVPFLMWVLIDRMGVSTVNSSVIASGGIFIARFLVFDAIGLLNDK